MNERNTVCHRFFSCFCMPWIESVSRYCIFIPPYPPQYEIDLIGDEQHEYEIRLSSSVNSTGLTNVKKQAVHFVKNSSGNHIAVLYINCNDEKRYTIIYSHGNAMDLGNIHKVISDLSINLQCDVVAYDYSGYGWSNGEPTEENLYADIKAVWDYTLAFHEPKADRIILYGHSLGTVPTVDLASKVQCAGVILQSPFKSILSVVCPKRKKASRYDKYINIEKLPKVTSPVLVIHGTNDKLIDISHGQAIYERCPHAVEPLWVEGAGHNDIEMQHIDRIRKFINEELSN